MNILVCPLNWGLGHATRCVPIINCLQSLGHEVSIGAGGRSLFFLRRQFPHLEVIDFPGYPVEYPRTRARSFLFVFQLPGFILSIFREHSFLKKLVRENNIQLVISDNRYGVYHSEIPGIFITHQLHIKFPRVTLAGIPLFLSGEAIMEWIIKSWLKKFSEIWIPDREDDHNLAGQLSHPAASSLNLKYISFLSRFKKHTSGTGGTGNNREPLKILALLSGPEPQRTLMESLLLKEIKTAGGNHAMLLGKPEMVEPDSLNSYTVKEGIKLYPHLEAGPLLDLILAAEVIICRPGYSTLMELAALQKEKIILIPTPGQTEQEYLGRNLEKNNIAPCIDQDSFSLKTGLEKLQGCEGFLHFSWDENYLESFINSHRLFNTGKPE